MKLSIRRIGNSLGVIIPKSTLVAWELGEGDSLDLSDRCIRPSSSGPTGHRALDEHKLKLARAVVSRCSAKEIRAQSLANLYRWKQAGAWVSAYDEWEELLKHGSDGELFAAMLGQDERANRLRQSPPYVGLLPPEDVRRLNEEAAA